MTHFDALWHDLRLAVRTLRHAPAVAATAVLTLAVGVGATTVMFSVLYGVLVEPLPYRDVHRSFVFSAESVSDVGGWKRRTTFSGEEFAAIRTENRVFDAMIGTRIATFLYDDGRSTRVLRGALVTANALDYFGMPPILGRPFTEADGRPGAATVFLLNDRTWRSEFGADRDLVGETFRLNGEPATLIGVMPERFDAYGADLWTAMNSADWGAGLTVMGRLRPGVDPEAARVDLDVILQRLALENPGGFFPARFRTVLRPYLDTVLGDFRRTLFGLLAAVLLLLAIAGVNVANLLLARATLRERDLAVRAAIGATNARLIRQLFAECLVIAGAAAVVGIILAYGGLQIVIAAIPAGTLPSETIIRINGPVLALSLAITVVTSILCGIAPALRLIRRGRHLQAGDGLRSTDGVQRSRARGALVVVEVALSVLLLTAAGLLLRGFLNLTRVDLGFNPRNVLFVRPWFPTDYTADQKNAFSRQLLARMQALPGVESAAQSMLVPPLTHDWSDTIIPGKPHVERWETRFELCSEDYFRLLGLRLLQGSLFSEADVLGKRLVTVVNQTFVDRYFPGENPLGRQVRFQVLDRPFLDAPHNVYFEIVGVVADHRTWGGEWQTVPQAFLPYSIQGFSWRTFLARTSVDPDTLQASVRDAIWAIDRSVGISASGSINGSLRDFYRDPQFDLMTLGAFAAAGLVLVGVGVFSVMAYTVSLRTREIGIRMAVGAMQRHIVVMVLGRGLRLIAAGCVLGGLLAYVFSRFFAAWMAGAPSMDVTTVGLVCGLLVAVGLAASMVPAIHAARVDPLVALRAE